MACLRCAVGAVEPDSPLLTIAKLTLADPGRGSMTTPQRTLTSGGRAVRASGASMAVGTGSQQFERRRASEERQAYRMTVGGGQVMVPVWSYLAVVGVVLVGCATQTTTQTPAVTLEQEIAALKGQVEELRRNQEATTREFAKIVLDTRAIRDELSQLSRRQEEADRLGRAVKDAVDGVVAQIGRLTETRPPTRELPSSVGSADALYNSAVSSYRGRDFYGAISGLVPFLVHFPDHKHAEDAQHLLAESYYALREFELALGEFLKLLDRAPKGPKAPDALLKVGLCYRALGNAGAARSTWERLIREHPASAEARRAKTLLADRSPQRR